MGKTSGHGAKLLTRRHFAYTAAGAAVLAKTMSFSASPARAQSPRAVVRKGYTDGPYGQIHYRFSGDPRAPETPLMCLHASPLSGIVYEHWIAEIGTDRFAVAPDTPGYGGSDTPPAPVLIPDFADAMIRFMDELGLGTVDVMGYHTGSITSGDLATRYPDRIRKVVMISAPIFDESRLVEYNARNQGVEPDFVQSLESLAASIRRDGQGMFRDVPTFDLFADICIERLRHYRTRDWGFRAAYAYDLATTLTKIEQPLLILNPEDDLWELTPTAAPYLRNGRIHDLPGWTHGAMDKHTGEMAAIVRDFLA